MKVDSVVRARYLVSVDIVIAGGAVVLTKPGKSMKAIKATKIVQIPWFVR